MVNGALIPIQTPPARLKAAYSSRTCFYALTMLAISDARKKFLWIRSGLPGSIGDSRAFKERRWYAQQKADGYVLHEGFYLLADGGFASEKWLLKPYPADQHDDKHKFFNYVLSSTRVIV